MFIEFGTYEKKIVYSQICTRFSYSLLLHIVDIYTPIINNSRAYIIIVQTGQFHTKQLLIYVYTVCRCAVGDESTGVHVTILKKHTRAVWLYSGRAAWTCAMVSRCVWVKVFTAAVNTEDDILDWAAVDILRQFLV